jgi:hypothetical protein
MMDTLFINLCRDISSIRSYTLIITIVIAGLGLGIILVFIHQLFQIILLKIREEKKREKQEEFING